MGTGAVTPPTRFDAPAAGMAESRGGESRSHGEGAGGPVGAGRTRGEPMKTNKVLLLAMLLALFVPTALLADGGDDDPVARDEALAIKNNVRAALEALGAPPTGYAKAEEDFDLPTSMGFDKAAHRFWLSESGGEFTFTNGLSGEQMGQEFQKKIMAAQAKGDYAEIQRLSTELQQGMAAAMGAEMSKVMVKVALNRRVHQEIDPEGVIWEAPGALAMRVEGEEPGKALVMIAFDPKALADTKSLSLVSLGETLNPSSATKTAVRTVVIEMRGPEATVVEWAKTVDKGKLLGLVRE